MLRQIQQEVKEWSLKNFENQQSWKPLLGAVEEIGELSHAHLKASQGIRTHENHDDDKKDALADIIIYLCDYASREGINLEQELIKTWNEVKQRDWKKNKKNGIE